MKIGLSSCGFELNDENFMNLQKSEIECIEISLPYASYPNLDYANAKRLSDKYGIELWSYHLPFSGPDICDIASLNNELRKKSVEYWCELIKKGSDIGIDKFVAHPSSEPKNEGELRTDEIKASMESLDILAEEAYKNGAQIAVEDLPRSCLGRDIKEMETLLSANNKLRICFDTNHLLKDDNLAFVERLADKIITLHVSDYDFIDEKHWLPGEGDVNWQSLYKKLCEAGYNGAWLYELGLRAPKTIVRSRDLCFEDFYNNACQIFNGKTLDVIGKR